jgi:hypothetical protein
MFKIHQNQSIKHYAISRIPNPPQDSRRNEINCKNLLLHIHLPATSTNLSILYLKQLSTMDFGIKKMMHTLKFFTKGTLHGFWNSSMSLIISSHNLVLKKQTPGLWEEFLDHKQQEDKLELYP